jgi:hypothetical protein
MFNEIWYLIVICVLASLIPACYFDITSRKIPIWAWYPAAYIGIPLSIILFTLKILFGELPIDTIYIYVGAALLMVGLTLALGYINVFGGAAKRVKSQSP